MFAEDIVHNTFLKLYENLNNIRNYQSVEIWIFTSARNEIFSHYRRKINKFDTDIEEQEEIMSSSNLCQDFETKELISIIEDALDKMDHSQSEVYYLKEYSGLSYREISKIMNIDEDLVKSRIYKVRQKLKSIITLMEKE